MKHGVVTLCLLWGAFFGLTEAFAGEIRVVDGVGLTRAVKSVPEMGTVSVRLKDQHAGPSEWQLINVDGLASDVTGVYSKDREVVFPGVRGGTWRIQSKGTPVPVEAVRITD